MITLKSCWKVSDRIINVFKTILFEYNTCVYVCVCVCVKTVIQKCTFVAYTCTFAYHGHSQSYELLDFYQLCTIFFFLT